MSPVSARMPTGIAGLDTILEGGIIRGNSLLIEGPPGSGKSTLGVRILYEGIVQHSEPGLIITFEEFPKQVYQESLNCGIDLQSLERAGMLRVVWTPPQRILESFTGKSDLVEKVVREMGVRRLVIDSITHFKRVAASEIDLREVLAGILSKLKLLGVNAILVKELERMDQETIAFEEYLVDASLRLHNTPSPAGLENVRHMEIRKTRGQGHISGRHPFQLDEHGLRVFPRLRPVDALALLGSVEPPLRHREPFGVPEIDAMLGGGLWSDSLALVSGYTGTGKSVLGHLFLDHALRAGQPCLMLNLRGTPESTLLAAASQGMDWQPHLDSGLLRILHRHPVGLCVEEVIGDLLESIREHRPHRLVCDSIDSLLHGANDEQHVLKSVSTLATAFKHAGVMSLVLRDLRGMDWESSQDSHGLRQLADCSITLSMAESGGELKRFITVEKHRGSEHAKDLREIRIDESGFRVLHKAAGLSGILTGQAQGSLECVGEEVLPVLDTVASALRELAMAKDIPEPAMAKIQSARQSMGLLDIQLRQHFGETGFREAVAALIEELDEESSS